MFGTSYLWFLLLIQLRGRTKNDWNFQDIQSHLPPKVEKQKLGFVRSIFNKNIKIRQNRIVLETSYLRFSFMN